MRHSGGLSIVFIALGMSACSHVTEGQGEPRQEREKREGNSVAFKAGEVAHEVTKHAEKAAVTVERKLAAGIRDASEGWKQKEHEERQKSRLESPSATPSSGQIRLSADMRVGKATYERTCRSCHGFNGKPNASIARLMKVNMRDLKSIEVQTMADGEIKKIIATGRGKMMPVKDVSEATAAKVETYVRSLK